MKVTPETEAYIAKLVALVDKAPEGLKVAVAFANDPDEIGVGWSCCIGCAYQLINTAAERVGKAIDAMDGPTAGSVH